MLVKVRDEQLKVLRAIVALGKGDPAAVDIDGYRVVAEMLWKAQHHKCCYCEKLIERCYSDVEHYRPKAQADRGPHHTATHGYWWLAFTWKNLLFSCPNCNRGRAKSIKFPLAKGGIPLVAEQPPGRRERALLLDPASECGVNHIEFRYVAVTKKWRPFARAGSAKGDETIRACLLDRDDLIELYTAHVEHKVQPEVPELRRTLAGKDVASIRKLVDRVNRTLLHPSNQFVGLSHDAIQYFIPAANSPRLGFAWPTSPAPRP